MPRDWEQTFSTWTGAEGTVEEEKAQRTLGRVRDAIAASADLASINVSVYPKGSYPNRTNVVRDSDMDVAVELTSIWNHEFTHDAEDLTIDDIGLTRYTGPYNQLSFKDHVEAALVAEFGRQLVERGNKAIRVKATANTIPADVVPCQTVVEHTSRTYERQGIRIRTDRGLPIINWPKQHLDEGLVKNNATTRRYKRTVRILKRLENEMVSNHVIEVVPSFLIESMIWNVVTPTFMAPSSWTGIVRAVIIEAYNDTKDDAPVKGRLLEANGIKYLFHPLQKWTRQQGNEFLIAAWGYVGFS
jgi:hypothetical protein